MNWFSAVGISLIVAAALSFHWVREPEPYTAGDTKHAKIVFVPLPRPRPIITEIK